tara:strand:- start:293 stop:1120 length:828 start_codon:yes stop_codon:yes gene_type:complete
MTKLNNVLIAGPWIGEFGWELFAWQAYIRSLSRKFEKTIILCRESSMDIYSDFASEYIFIEAKGVADSFFMHNVDMDFILRETMLKNKHLLSNSTTIFKPRRIGSPPFTHYTSPIPIGKWEIKPEYIRFGKQEEPKYDYIFHARSRQLRKEDNWNTSNWNSLINLLPTGSKVACIGTISESQAIEGAADLRGASLKDVFNIMRNAKCAFGSSSGPMHLASLCGCPHVVWSIKDNYNRYTENWNPLKTPVLFDSEYKWHPPAEHIYEQYQRWDINE